MKWVIKLSLCYFYVVQSSAFDTISINENNALFTAFHQTVPIISTNYIGWNANWAWAGATVNSEIVKQDQELTAVGNKYLGAKFSGDATALGLRFSGVAGIAEQQITWRYRWEKAKTIIDALGFGIEFNLNLKSQSFETPSFDPVLLDNKKGWQWDTPSGNTITVTFEPQPASVYFERNQKNQIRVLFFNGIQAGLETTEMVVHISPKVKIVEPVLLKYGNSDKRLWYPNGLSPDYSPVDLSFLNDKPAGTHGFIKAEGDKLVFEDGTEGKFWGANLMAYALFTTKDEDVKKHAQRIARLGMNLIRIHHHDSDWVKPNIFLNQEKNTQQLAPEALKKLDWWIKCLKDEGVYVWLDMHVGRAFTKNDGIDYFDELAKGKETTEVKGYNYYNSSIQKQMIAFNQAYLTHVNQFTGLAYKDDPTVLAILLTNENDLTQHFGNALLPDKGAPMHNQLFTADALTFAETNRLPYDNVWRTWLPGESKIYLNDVEHRFNRAMIEPIRKLGYKSLISTTNSFGGIMSLASLPALTDGDIVDVHSYGGAEELSKNPRYNPSYLAWLGAAQVSGKPLSVTEWNIEPFPASDRFTAPIYTAGIASLQGWDAMMLYGYSQVELGGWSNGSNYSSFNDPAMMGMMPAAALLYRQGHVKQASKTYEIVQDRNKFYFNGITPDNSKAIRTLLETSRLTVTMPKTKELPWLQNNNEKKSAIVETIKAIDMNQDFIQSGQNFVQSDTGELNRNWQKGIQTINTPKSQIISGWVGWESIDLDNVQIRIINPQAVIAVQSMDSKPITESGRILITTMARSETATGNNLPFLSEPVVGSLKITAKKGLTLVPMLPTGEYAQSIATEYNNGKYQINLSPGFNSHWWILKEAK